MSENETTESEGGKGNKKERKVFSHAALAVHDAIGAVKGLAPVTFTRANRLVDVASSGSLALDLILGGGYSRGRYITIFGPESCGKSTLAQELIAACQRVGITVVHYDYESGTDPVYMAAQGASVDHKVRLQALKVPWSRKKKGTVDVPDYFPFNPENGEQVYVHMLETLGRLPKVKGGPPKIVFIIDSQSSMQSTKLNEYTGEGQMAANANMHSKFLAMIKPRLARRGAFIFAINQMRSKIGSWGNPEQEAGGNAIRFWADIKLLMTTSKPDKDKSGLDIRPVKIRTPKNKTFIPFRVLDDFGLVLGRGIDKALDTRQFLKKLGMCEIDNGRVKVNTPKYKTKALSWKDFRTLAENEEFRSYCFSLLKEDSTYELFYRHEGVANFSYDEAAAEEDETPPRRRRVKGRERRVSKKAAARVGKKRGG